MKIRQRLPIVLLLAGFSVTGQEPSVTLHSTVMGNQDQPRVMYFLPWQPAGDAHFDQAFSAGLAGDLFLPIDRGEFLRTLKYQTMLDAAATNATDKGTDVLLITQ